MKYVYLILVFVFCSCAATPKVQSPIRLKSLLDNEQTLEGEIEQDLKKKLRRSPYKKITWYYRDSVIYNFKLGYNYSK